MLENIFTENGWTFATYKCNGNEYKLSNSHLFDNDVIKKILLMIYSFIVGEKTHGHIIWNEESQYYIFEYELKEGNIGIKLYYCNEICYKDTISNNAFDINRMTLVSNEERVFWNWAEETFNNIESFYDKENADIVKLNRPIEIEEKIKFFFK